MSLRNEYQAPRPTLVLRPCGCRFGASDGYYSHVPVVARACSCCGKTEDTTKVDRTPPWQRGRAKPRPDVLWVCADCLVDWKGIEARDARKKA